MPTVPPPEVPPVRYDVQLLLAHCGRVLRQAREQHGLTLEDLAAKTGITKSYIAYLETGERDMSLGRILRLAHALGVPFMDLLPPEEPSVLARLMLLVHARGPAFADRLLALLEVPPDCLKRPRS